MPLLKYRSKEQWKEIKENARSAHQKRAGIGNIHEVVRKAFKKKELPDPYDKFNENFGDKYEAELHASIGKKMTEEGKNVLQIDVAGSGVQQPVNMQEGFTGENTIKDGEFEYDIEKFRTLERKKVGWWNRLFSFLPFVWSEEKIQRYNEFLNKYGRKETPDRRTSDPSETFRAQETESFEKKQIQETKTSPRNQTQTIIREDDHAMPEKEHFKTGAEKIFAGRYGTTPKNKNLKEKELIHMKEKTDTAEDGTKLLRRRYAMAGPQGGIFGTKLGAGVSNKGDYSINNLSNYILEAGKEYLGQIFNNWKTEDDAKSHPINISLRGHSRGAVAVSHGAMKLKYWLNKYYPQYEPYVTFNLIQNDPVPGYGSDHGLKQKINLQNETRADLKKEMEKREMKELGDSVNSTVVYSLHTQYPVFFSPQSVDGAKRIILTAGTHSVNTDHVDRSQSDKAHRQPYMDMETGEVYRSSGLSELPEGIYIADENYRLVRIPNFEIAKDILENVLAKAGGQGERHKRIKEVIKNWYEARTTGKKSSEQGREKDPGQENGEKDELKDLDKDTVSKIRNQNAAREFYPGYESMISIQVNGQKKAAVTRQMNSNNIEELRTWVADIEEKMKNDPKTYDQETAKFRDYLQHRLTKLEKIKKVIDKADENMQNHKVGELICSEYETGYKTYYVKDVKQPAIQSTHNGCWSVAISTLLKHRGVDLEQSAIRAYRPDQESFPNDFPFVNKDKANSISAYSDLIQSVLPNTAVNDAHYNSFKNYELSESERKAELSRVAEAMKTAITYAMDHGRGPVAMLVGGHYRTVYGLTENQNGVTVTLYDPYESKPQTMKLEDLAEKAWMPTRISDSTDDNPFKEKIVSEQFVFETQWLQDLKNIEGKLNLDEELNTKIEYKNDGELALKGKAEKLEVSNCHTHIVNNPLANNLTHSTYLPNKLRDIQLKKEKNSINREKLSKEELEKFVSKHAQEAPVTAGKIALDEKIPKQPKRTNSVSFSDERKK